MEVRTSRASAVVIQRIPLEKAEWFMEWQKGITAAAESSPGYSGSDVYPPSDAQSEWVVVLHFEDDEFLNNWLNSTVRRQWLEKLHERIGEFELQVLPGGLGAWFTDVFLASGKQPPSWKIALCVLLGLYPTVMSLTLFPGSFISSLGPAVATLIGNILCVAILQWVVMPALNRLLASWLAANSYDQRILSYSGVIIMVFLLGGMTLLFRQVMG